MSENSKLSGVRIGLCVTGSFCTLSSFIPYIQNIIQGGAEVTAIFSERVQKTDTRFSTAWENRVNFEEMTGKKIITSIEEAEPIGPKGYFDILAVAPCTGNTLARISYGLTDGAVTMAVKSHLRIGRPLVIGLSTNDALAANAKNLGLLLNTRNVYFVPLYQDDPVAKERSLTFDFKKFEETLVSALEGRQLQPILAASAGA